MLFFVILERYTFESKLIFAILFAILLYLVIHFLLRMLEMAYVLKYKKPYYTHFYFYLRKLNPEQKIILKNRFVFYNKLTEKQKKYFEHRVASFIKDKDFIGRDGVVVTDEMKVLISATGVMLTFGFRDFYIGLLSKIVIYPTQFFSRINNEYHKGEFNPKLKALVISWEDYNLGFKNSHDNINLGIHEFTHAIHLNSIKERDVSATIFSDLFKELTDLLTHKESLRLKLLDSEYFRTYGYTNQFEFLAVLVENFIETPSEFKSQFPEVYSKVKQMLNFNFSGY
jgi:MtfA peptidase